MPLKLNLSLFRGIIDFQLYVSSLTESTNEIKLLTWDFASHYYWFNLCRVICLVLFLSAQFYLIFRSNLYTWPKKKRRKKKTCTYPYIKHRSFHTLNLGSSLSSFIPTGIVQIESNLLFGSSNKGLTHGVSDKKYPHGRNCNLPKIFFADMSHITFRSWFPTLLIMEYLTLNPVNELKGSLYSETP